MRQFLNGEESCDLSPASLLGKPAKRRKPANKAKSNDKPKDSSKENIEPSRLTEQENSTAENPVSGCSNCIY